MSDFNNQEFYQKLEETKSEKQRRSLSPDELDRYLRYFTADELKYQLATQSPENRDACKERIELLRGEIGLRRLESLSKSQHVETMVLGGNTLNWTKVAAWGAIAAVVVALIGLGGQSYCSRTTSTPPEARPTPTATPQQSDTPTPT
jgi:hypothetical protein